MREGFFELFTYKKLQVVFPHRNLKNNLHFHHPPPKKKKRVFFISKAPLFQGMAWIPTHFCWWSKLTKLRPSLTQRIDPLRMLGGTFKVVTQKTPFWEVCKMSMPLHTNKKNTKSIPYAPIPSASGFWVPKDSLTGYLEH